MKKIFTAGNLQEAYLLLGLLQNSGIAVTVKNENLQGAIGEIPFTHAYPELHLLDERDEMAAKAIIAEYETSRINVESRKCPYCGEENPGNFSSCWSCDRLFDKL